MVIDNFLSPEDFVSVQDEVDLWTETLLLDPTLRTNPNDDGTWRSHWKSEKDRGIFEYPDIMKRYTNHMDIDFMLEHFSNHRPFNPDEVGYVTEIQVTSADYKYRVHNDASRKLFTCVVYLSGHGEGTRLYNVDGSFHSEVEWKPNRAIIFCPISKVTWHSYQARDKPRQTILYNIVTTGNRVG